MGHSLPQGSQQAGRTKSPPGYHPVASRHHHNQLHSEPFPTLLLLELSVRFLVMAVPMTVTWLLGTVSQVCNQG